MWVGLGEVGKVGAGLGERRAETGAPMAPKMGVSSQVPSVLNDHTGGGLGGREGAGVP